MPTAKFCLYKISAGTIKR